MKRYILLASIATMILVISGCTNNKHSNETMNNKSTVSTETITTEEKSDLKKPDIEEARDFEASLKNGSVIMISRDNLKKQEVYNIAMLDKFIDSFNNGKEGYVRIIKGILNEDGTLLVNKLEVYETDGKVIKDTGYDTYADKNKFIPVKPIYSPKMVKTHSDNAIRYVIFQSKKDTPDNIGRTVISFYKNSIKN